MSHVKKISLLITNQNCENLKTLFGRIVSSNEFDAVEVVYIDNARDPETWDFILTQINIWGDAITAVRNTRAHTQKRNRENLHRLRRCDAYVEFLEFSKKKLDDLILEIHNYLNENSNQKFKYLKFSNRGKIDIKNGEKNSHTRAEPLVSITLHNYNYGRFLRECLESIFSQTYKNIQILFSDNASSDDSWAIANEFAKKFPDRLMITRNRTNFGASANLSNCQNHVEGDFFLNMCSDDFLEPECIERCVTAFRRHADLAMVMFHRFVVTENGEKKDEAPFFKKSFKTLPGEICDVYLMSSINPTISQIMYRRAFAYPKMQPTLVDRWFGARIRDFVVASNYSFGYLNEPLVNNRIHGSNDGKFVEENLLEVIGPYVCNIEFSLLARDAEIVLKNTERATEKLANLSLRYAVRALVGATTELAERYFHLSAALDQRIAAEPNYKRIQGALYHPDLKERQKAIEALLLEEGITQRRISYDPPQVHGDI